MEAAGNTTGPTLIQDASARQVKRLKAGTAMAIDDTTNPGKLILSCTAPSTLDAFSTNSTTGIGVGGLTTAVAGSVAGGPYATAITTGGNNTPVGHGALQVNTNGNQKYAVGFQALNKKSSGLVNTAVGCSTTIACTSGSQNTAVGTFTFTLPPPPARTGKRLQRERSLCDLVRPTSTPPHRWSRYEGVRSRRRGKREKVDDSPAAVFST